MGVGGKGAQEPRWKGTQWRDERTVVASWKYGETGSHRDTRPPPGGQRLRKPRRPAPSEPHERAQRRVCSEPVAAGEQTAAWRGAAARWR